MEKDDQMYVTSSGTSEESAWRLGLCLKPPKEVTDKKSQSHFTNENQTSQEVRPSFYK